MVEVGSLPSGGSVTRRAVRTEARWRVGGIGRRLKVRAMACVAVRACAAVHAADMALGAICRNMGPGQREGRLAVIECRWNPYTRGVT
jgi:hypothetical protein